MRDGIVLNSENIDFTPLEEISDRALERIEKRSG